MASITLDTPVAEALNKSIHGRIVSEGWTQDDDTALAEYIVLMLANGKTQEQIASELASDLLPDAQGTEEFSQWLFDQVTQLTGGGSSAQAQSAASDAPAQPESAESAIPAAYETDMAEAPPDNAYVALPFLTSPSANIANSPKGPRNSSMSRGGRGGRGGLPSKPADSALHRTRGNDRINSHNVRGAPKGPRGGLQNRPGMQKALNGLVSPAGPGMMQNGMQNQQGGNMQFSPEQQMQYLHMMEQQAQLMAQWNQLQQGVNFQGGAPQGRGYTDRGRGGRGRGRGAFQNQNGARNGSAATSENKDGEPASADASMEGVEQPAAKTYDPATTMCHFNSRCTNKTCPYAHQSPAAPMNIPVDTSQVCQFGVACKSVSCTARHPSPALKSDFQANSECRFYPNCTKPNCPFSHPSAPLCSFGASCTKENCQFTHLSTMCRFNPCTNALCKFKHTEGQNRSISDYTWTPAKQQEAEKKHLSDRKFVSEAGGEEELIKGEEASAPVKEEVSEETGTVT